jgi:hypothetical protein
MLLVSLLFAALVAALPYDILVPPSAADKVDVSIRNITAIGTGCPKGHSVVNLNPSGTVFDVGFDSFVVSVGPGSATSDSRKNCRMSLNLAFTSGYQ